MSDPVICTDGLVKEFRVGFLRRLIRAVDRLDLEVRKGEIFGFLGPNGAGKTTTIKLLLGLIGPTQGRITLLGRDWREVGIRQQIGFLPESPYFYDYLKAGELLNFYGQLFGLDRRERRQRGAELLKLVGLEDSADLQLRKYSKGMLQRLGIAQALINHPSLIILDEPMSGLDPVGRREIRDIILRLRGEGRTIFFSSHILPDVEAICDRVGIMVGGRLRSVGPLEELLGEQLSHVEITAAGLDQVGVQRLREMAPEVVERGPHFFIRVDKEEQIEPILQVIQERRGRLLSLIPHKGSLEELFLREALPSRRSHL